MIIIRKYSVRSFQRIKIPVKVSDYGRLPAYGKISIEKDKQQIPKLFCQTQVPTGGSNKATEVDLYNTEKVVVPAREKGNIEI